MVVPPYRVAGSSHDSGDVLGEAYVDYSGFARRGLMALVPGEDTELARE